MNITKETNDYTYNEYVEQGICPYCGAALTPINGCDQCYECGFSACSN